MDRVKLGFFNSILLLFCFFHSLLLLSLCSSIHLTWSGKSLFCFFFNTSDTWAKLHTMLPIENALLFTDLHASCVCEIESIVKLRNVTGAVLCTCLGVQIGVEVRRLSLIERTASTILLWFGWVLRDAIGYMMCHLLTTDDLLEVRIGLPLEEYLWRDAVDIDCAEHLRVSNGHYCCS